MENKADTVILSLQTYEDMKKEIAQLKEQVKEKTIIKYYDTPMYEYLGIVFVIVLGVVYAYKFI